MFFHFLRRIAGYVTAKKGKTGNKATSKREQRKFTCFAEREWVRATKPRVSESKESLLALPSGSGFVQQ